MSEEMNDELQPQVKEETVVAKKETTPVEKEIKDGAKEVEPRDKEDNPKPGETTETEQTQEGKKEDKPKENDLKPKEDDLKPKEDDLKPKEDDLKPKEGDSEANKDNIKPKECKPDEEEIDPEKEELVAQLEDLRAEKEEREALEKCNREVMKVEQEFTACTDRIAQALKDSFTQNGIDPSKTLAELEKEEPTKATLAKQFIEQAQQLRAQLEEAAMKEITRHQNNVIYLAASREFEKMGLNLEQAKEAVKTFKRIANEVGIADLGEDLKMKVQLAAGRAKMLHPAIEQVAAPETVDTTKIEKPNPEKGTGEKTKETKDEKEVPPTLVVEKPKASDFEEGVAGQTSANAGTLINELNVLEELAKLPYKERARFYKEHEDVITKALSQRG